MAAGAARSFATACVLAVLLAGCLRLPAAADARRLLYDDDDAAMPPAPMAYAVDYDYNMSPALAPAAPESGADDDDDLAGQMFFHGRGLLDTGLHLAGRLLLGLGL
ncbi:hypothetical protein SORBI_3001G169500 [Sorghum bicolor]|uniref:Uncharacterized protein n=1 Tax=Sorghum bicolor TaxID=4558 RepID=A0A1B6QJE2_SORBI|nr:hypothetical protein SORBI_3001G169500 [Sorghum bicolor]